MKISCSNCLHNYEEVDTSTGRFIVIGRFCGVAAEILSRHRFSDCIVPVLGGDADKENDCRHWESNKED